jgi:hypothetical protein
MQGSDNGAPGRPDLRVTMANTSAEQVIRVFGTVSGSNITSIGFRSTRGITHGPSGAGYGDPFSVDGLLLGFFGALENGMVSGVGVWFTPISGPNPWPGPWPLPVTYLEMSPAYGGLSNAVAWDDTTLDMGGAYITSRLDTCSSNEPIYRTFLLRSKMCRQHSQHLTVCVPCTEPTQLNCKIIYVSNLR